MTRYFRSTDETLDAVRQMLDREWQYPDASTKTDTALPAAADCPHDAQGRVYLAVDDAYCEYVLPSQILPSLIDSGTVEEISLDEYMTVIPTV